MGERIGNIRPKYAVRLSDLRNWHLLTAKCLACGHRARMRMWQLTIGRWDDTKLLDVEKWLRCMRCGNRGTNRIYVSLTDIEPE